MNHRMNLLTALCICWLVMTTQSQVKRDNKEREASLPKCVKKDAKDYSPSQFSLNALVYDGQKMFAKGLSIDDFQVLENGQAQKIISVEEIKGPLHIGLVIDNSGSLRTQLGLVISIGKVITKNLDPNDQIFSMRFISSDKIEIINDWTTNKTAVQRELDNLYTEGGLSAIIDAMYLAASKMKEPSSVTPGARRVLILISDGEDKNSFYKRGHLWHILQESQAQVFPVYLWKELESDKRNKAEELLQQMAFVSGGRVFSVGKKWKEEGEAAVKGLLEEIFANYTIRYEATNPISSNSSRSLEVKLADPQKAQKFTIATRSEIHTFCQK